MKKIILYGNKYSYFTEEAKKWLEVHSLEYEERSAQDPKNLNEVFKLSGQYAVPVIVIGKGVIIGFDEKKLEEALKKEA